MRLVLLFIVAIVTSINLHAYSYAAAGKEPTIDSKEAILKSINDDDFQSAKTIFFKYKENYQYLSVEFNSLLFEGLKNAIDKKDKSAIVKWLNVSIASEIQRRLDGGLKNIKQFNIAKVMLAKANKFYKILSPSLSEETNKKLNQAIKKCIESIGNPGLFGVGAKPINIEEYQKNQEIAIKILKSL
ncbi:hypothetical protein [Arcobacter sp. LA11]|uniref:hypothetical protein n=1 Tax=Arcobacter sp. LA11 TaxID=1898176 RepID=UPI0009326D81|nr:hypothetical protein [Arcobacter sp. LA11]